MLPVDMRGEILDEWLSESPFAGQPFV